MSLGSMIDEVLKKNWERTKWPLQTFSYAHRQIESDKRRSASPGLTS
jgi:hypothetical protein